MVRLFVLGGALAACATGLCTDWAALNAASRTEAMTELRPGEPGKCPFWNAQARAYIHPPAFGFADIPVITNYRFTVTEMASGTRHVFSAAHPWMPLTPVWDALPPGYVQLVVEGVDDRGLTVGIAGSAYFYRAARFNGPYPSGDRDYAAAAKRCYEAVFRLPYVQGWLTQDTPPEGYDLYCYPSKILASLIGAMVRYSRQAPAADAEKALTIASKMADWLIAQSQPEGSVLEFIPPTYWGDRRKTAVEYAGQNMMLYPVFAGLAYFELAGADGVWRPARILNLVRTVTGRDPQTAEPTSEFRGQLEGCEIVLAADGVPAPVRARHLFRKPWRSSVYNEVSLPMGAFDVPVAAATGGADSRAEDAR